MQWCGPRLLRGLKGLVEERCRRSRLELRCFEGLLQWVPHSTDSYVLHLDARPLGDHPNGTLGRHILHGYLTPWRRLVSAKYIAQSRGLPAEAG